MEGVPSAAVGREQGLCAQCRATVALPQQRSWTMRACNATHGSHCDCAHMRGRPRHEIIYIHCAIHTANTPATLICYQTAGPRRQNSWPAVHHFAHAPSNRMRKPNSRSINQRHSVHAKQWGTMHIHPSRAAARACRPVQGAGRPHAAPERTTRAALSKPSEYIAHPSASKAAVTQHMHAQSKCARRPRRRATHGDARVGRTTSTQNTD